MFSIIVISAHSNLPVTDRLAYLNFVQGSLASSLSAKLDSARAPLKALRDAETTLQPRRNIRIGLHNQIARIEHEQQKEMKSVLSICVSSCAKPNRTISSLNVRWSS